MPFKNKQDRLEYNKRYYQEHKETIKQQNKLYKDEHKEYYTELNARYRERHKDELSNYHNQWVKDNQDKMNGYSRKYRQTKNGRAHRLVLDYKTLDKKKNLGECTLTSDWIYKNILSGQCIYCGESDWQKLGCDRIDNSKPHTPENCVPCCWNCNNRRGTKSYFIFTAINQPNTIKLEYP